MCRQYFERERRALLQKTLGNSGVRLSESLPGTLSQIIQAVKDHGLEGVIAKRLDSEYQPDRRSDDWLIRFTNPNFKLPFQTQSPNIELPHCAQLPIPVSV